MNNETIRSNDLTLIVPIYPPTSSTSSAELSTSGMLFGASTPAVTKAPELARGLTEKIAEVLKVLHDAHLAGHLHAGDLHAKQVLEAWYMQLQAESRAAQGK